MAYIIKYPNSSCNIKLKPIKFKCIDSLLIKKFVLIVSTWL